MARKKFTDEELIDMYKNYFSDKEIARAFGVHCTAVGQRRHKLGLPPLFGPGEPKKFTDEEFLNLYNRGLNDVEIAKELGVSQSTIWQRRRKLGLPSHHLRGGYRRPYSEDKRNEIYKMWKDGVPVPEIAEKLGCDVGYLHGIIGAMHVAVVDGWLEDMLEGVIKEDSNEEKKRN